MTAAITTTTITPYLCARGAAEAIDFYKRAFGAVETAERYTNDDGTVGHAELRIGDSTIYISDEYAAYRIFSPKTLNGISVSLSLSTPDADAAFERAVSAGATIERPLNDEPYGRSGWLLDPFGHHWNIHGPVKGNA